MTRDIEEQIREDQGARLAMKEYDFIKWRKGAHERLIYLAGPVGRRLTAQDCAELQVGALAVQPGRAKCSCLGICRLPLGDERMMESVGCHDETYAANSRGGGRQFIGESDRR